MIDCAHRLQWILRLLSLLCLSAVIPTLMPLDWITAAHAAMQMGEFPSAPIAEYLARCTSALSAFYGGLIWVLSSDVVRYRAVIRYQAWGMIAVSTVSLGVGAMVGIPLVWVLIDLVGCWIFAMPTLWLERRLTTGLPKLAEGTRHSARASGNKDLAS